MDRTTPPIYAQILLPQLQTGLLDYQIPNHLVLDAHCGSWIEVPFRKNTMVGCIWHISSQTDVPLQKIKTANRLLQSPGLSQETRSFLTKAAYYNCQPLGNFFKLCLSVPTLWNTPKSIKNKQNTLYSDDHMPLSQQPNWHDIILPDLSDLQAKTAEQLQQQLPAKHHNVTVLDGVTGSGKTELYLHYLATQLQQDPSGQHLILVPEIALTIQTLERAVTRLGVRPAIWHADISAAEKKRIWHSVLNGHTRMVIGARSALFLPFRSLHSIIVDEEHDPAFKQEEGTLYHGRDMAVLRAHTHKIPIILASATPSLESIANTQRTKYHLLTLPSRFGKAQLPTMHVIDMRRFPKKTNEWISPPLLQALSKNLSEQKQALLFLNRRGYAPITLCRHCGFRFSCPHCATNLVQHRTPPLLQCHHCGYEHKIPDNCPQCATPDSLLASGPGIERLLEEIQSKLPTSRIAVLSRDTVHSAKQADALLQQIIHHQVDIIIGTQMIAKGHHFPQLAIVGVIDADLGLAGVDLRASEHSYQLLHQVSGRAGRSHVEGHVFLQSYFPDNHLLNALCQWNKEDFIEGELLRRHELLMPPFARLAAIIISSPERRTAEKAAHQLRQSAPTTPDITVLGPVEALLSPLRSNYRYRLLIRAPLAFPLSRWIHQWLGQLPPRQRQWHYKVDIDPYSFM